MINIKKSILILIMAVFGCGMIFADLPEGIVKREVEKVNTYLEEGKIEEAYKNITSLLSTFQNNEIPGSVTFFADSVIDAYLDLIEAEKQYSKVSDVEAVLNSCPKISSPKLAQKVSRVKQLAEKESQTYAINKIGESTSSIGKWIILVLVVVLVIAALIFIIFVHMAKAQAHQTEQFDATLKIVAGMQQANNQLLLGNVTDIGGLGALRVAGSSSTWGKNVLPAPEMSDEEKAEFKVLAIKCEELGEKIDQLTKRKNNSKNVSELVYKLAIQLGLNQNTSMAYFCAAMVYDAGFITVPEEILSAETLSEEQREELKKHVSNPTETYAFVPDIYKRIFEDAAMYHHENVDGSGYPMGLKDEEIPQVARLIHVAESYNSLISRRDYRQIQDKESAVEELKSKPGLYDMTVVNALDAIV